MPRWRPSPKQRFSFFLAYALVSPTVCLLERRRLHVQARRQSPPPANGRRRLMHAAGGIPPTAAASFGSCRPPSAVVAASGGGRSLQRRGRHPLQRLPPPERFPARGTSGLVLLRAPKCVTHASILACTHHKCWCVHIEQQILSQYFYHDLALAVEQSETAMRALIDREARDGR